nr:hypothetical protein [Tanacetum cinerariifolium]
MTSLADKAILYGADNRPPMLEKDMYGSWKSRMELYMLNRQHDRMILKLVEQRPLLWPTIEEDGVTRLKKYSELSAAKALQPDCDVKETNIILQEFYSEIYALLSTHKVAKELWERIQMLMQGTSLTKQERECKFYDEFDKIAYRNGETLRDFYLRFSLLLNDMNMYNMKLEQFQVNTKFLNTLPPEWSKFVTDIKLVRDLHTTNVDQLHAYLGQHEYHANEGDRGVRLGNLELWSLSTQWLRIGRINFRLPSDIQSKEATLQVVYDVLRNSPLFRAFQVTADVPEIYTQEFWATAKLHHNSIRFKIDTRKIVLDLEAFREMLHISPRIPNQPFADLPIEEEILEFLRFLGYSHDIRYLTDVNVNKLYQPWRSFSSVINKCLTGKSSGVDSFRLSQAQMLWGFYHRINIDFAYLIWEDFVYQVEHKSQKKSNEMNYPRFTKVIIDYFMTRKPSVSRRNIIHWHYVRDDALFSTIKVEYHACAMGEGAPKPKASARKKKGDSASSTTPPTPTPTTTVESAPRLSATAKGKQPLRAKTPVEPTDLQRTEAEQLKIVLKRSRQETHSSQQSGFGIGEGTGSKPGVLDVPSDDSEEELSSFGTDLDSSLRTDLDGSIGTDLIISLRIDLDGSSGTDLVSSLRTDLDGSSGTDLVIHRDDDQIYKFKEGDFKRLRLQDIEDMLLLLVQGKLSNLTVEERLDFNVSLRMFTKSIVIKRRVEDLQLGVESYQKKLNLKKPDTYLTDLRRREAYTAYSNPRGFIYENKDKKNRLIRIDELHKFSDGTLNDVRNALDDRLKGIRMQYLPSTIWRKGDKDRAAAMIQAIEKMLKTRRIMRSLEKFVGGRLDDIIFSTIKVVSRHHNTQQYGVVLPIELANEEIKNTKAYKEHYACATEEAAPKPKASARRKRSGSDNFITPPTAITTSTTTVAVTPRLTATAKGKQLAKAKSPSDPSELARTEAQQ